MHRAFTGEIGIRQLVGSGGIGSPWSVMSRVRIGAHSRWREPRIGAGCRIGVDHARKNGTREELLQFVDG